jgi:hypothetical protein
MHDEGSMPATFVVAYLMVWEEVEWGLQALSDRGEAISSSMDYLHTCTTRSAPRGDPQGHQQ